jgi:AraC family transcriptional regulator
MEKVSAADNLSTGIEMGMSYMEDTTQDFFHYFAGGLTLDLPKTLPKGFVKKELSIGEYIVCRIEAEDFESLVTTALNRASKYLFNTWLLHHGLTTEAFSVEKYYHDSKDMACMEIWVKPMPMKNRD